jgi:hypothetical protein
MWSIPAVTVMEALTVNKDEYTVFATVLTKLQSPLAELGCGLLNDRNTVLLNESILQNQDVKFTAGTTGLTLSKTNGEVLGALGLSWALGSPGLVGYSGLPWSEGVLPAIAAHPNRMKTMT